MGLSPTDSLASKVEEVPVIDISQPVATAAPQVASALKRFGFFYAKSHGVPEALMREQFEQSEKFFSLPIESKRELAFVPELDIGYLTNQALDEDTGAVDTKEGFMFTNNGVMQPGFKLNQSDPLSGSTALWPPLAGYELTIRSYVKEVTRVNHVLNRLLFASLGLGDDARLALASQPFTVLKQMRYMPGAGQDSDSLGAGAHADWGALTILASDGNPGLEVELDGEWLPVPPREGCLIINAGDQIYHWTNAEYRSATHRVLHNIPKPRFSTAFFTYFDIDTVMSPLAQFITEERPALRQPESSREYFHFKLFESTGNLDLLEENTTNDACTAKGSKRSVVEWSVAPVDGGGGIGAMHVHRSSTES